MGDFFCLSVSDAFSQEPPRSAINIFQINAVKVFSSAVYQETFLYAQVGETGAGVQVA